MIRRPPRSTQSRSSAASDVYKRQIFLSLTLSVVTTILVVSTILYINFEKEASAQIFLANMKSLEQVNHEVLGLANSARTVSSQIFQDVNVAKLLYYAEPDVYDLGPALRQPVSYTHLRAHETRHDLVCRLLLEK